MRKCLLILCVCLVTKCFAQDISHPSGFILLKQKTGDLNKDGIAEMVVVYNTPDTTEYGAVRELRIFKRVRGAWQLWIKSRNAVLKSQEGGMMGDPFEDIEISNGLLVISFSGGSSWKWSSRDKYRFQNNRFQLIGYYNHYGKLCEYWQEFDYNLSTGKVIYKKEYEDCDNNQSIYKTENEVFFKKQIPIDIQNRYPSEREIITPKYKTELFL